MTLPGNGTTYNLSYPITTTTKAVRKVDAQQVVSVPPGLKPLLGLGASLNSSSTGSLRPKAAVIDPILGAGPSVTQVSTSVASGGAATTASGATANAAQVVLFGSNYFTSKLGGTVSSTVTFNPKTASNTSSEATGGGVASFLLGKFFDKNAPANVTEKLANSSKDMFTPPIDLTQYTFNLSPHSWSLPLAPSTVDHRDFKNYIISPGNAQDKGKSSTKSDVVGTNSNTSPKNPMRRGRISWYATASDLKYTGSGTKPTANARQMGFQFLWNPDSFGTAVSLNPDVTPSMQDRFVGVAGAFPGQETITLNLEINRINDFACFAKLKSTNNYNDTYKQYYKNAYPYGVPQAFDKQINDLLKLALHIILILNNIKIIIIIDVYINPTDFVAIINPKIIPSKIILLSLFMLSFIINSIKKIPVRTNKQSNESINSELPTANVSGDIRKNSAPHKAPPPLLL
jgi:hypothetical protein